MDPVDVIEMNSLLEYSIQMISDSIESKQTVFYIYIIVMFLFLARLVKTGK